MSFLHLQLLLPTRNPPFLAHSQFHRDSCPHLHQQALGYRVVEVVEWSTGCAPGSWKVAMMFAAMSRRSWRVLPWGSEYLPRLPHDCRLKKHQRLAPHLHCPAHWRRWHWTVVSGRNLPSRQDEEHSSCGQKAALSWGTGTDSGGWWSEPAGAAGTGSGPDGAGAGEDGGAGRAAAPKCFVEVHQTTQWSPLHCSSHWCWSHCWSHCRMKAARAGSRLKDAPWWQRTMTDKCLSRGWAEAVTARSRSSKSSSLHSHWAGPRQRWGCQCSRIPAPVCTAS